VRIVTGSLKGRRIPTGRLGNLRLTSARLKEAVFGMLGPDLRGQCFLDLCAGSGQMGLEALSRGARAVLNEPDRRRYRQLGELLRQWQVQAELYSAKAQILIARFEEEQRSFDALYLDPPYSATHAGRPLALALVARLGQAELLAPGGLLLVQHPLDLELPQQSDSLTLQRQRRYGHTLLSIYGPA
jgi:16S rRNA (guanine(966)-N(2))-methyltransferase RsmD